MYHVVYYIMFFTLLGGIGMAIANRKVELPVQRQRWIKYFMYLLIIAIVIASIFFHFFYWLAWLIILIVAIELYKVNTDNYLKRSAAIKSFVIFLAIATGFIFFANITDKSFQVFIYFQVLVFDGFCQITGQLVGRHQLAPAISPGKTWEGLAGGWICCIVAAILAAHWMNSQFNNILFGLLIGTLTSLFSLCGDLLASWYKRKAQVKDYSNWLPGQGGFLDRFDSFLLTGGIYYLLYFEFGEFVKYTD